MSTPSAPTPSAVTDEHIDMLVVDHFGIDADADVAIDFARAVLALAAPAESGAPAAWSTGINWGHRESEMVVKLTRKAQPEHGFVHPLYAAPAAPKSDASQPASSSDWMPPTTYLQRFGDAMALLCGKRPPDEMLAAWLDTDADDHRLQEFAVNNGPAWAQGIGLIDAARVMADQPTEGVDHEFIDEPASSSAPAVGAVSIDGYLCRAWGESDEPIAMMVHDLEGVARFMVECWLGDESATDYEGTPTLPRLKEEWRDREWKDEAPWSVEFEIGGVSVEKMMLTVAAPAGAAGQDAALLRQALEALESCGSAAMEDGGQQWFDDKLVDAAHEAITAALAATPPTELDSAAKATPIDSARSQGAAS